MRELLDDEGENLAVRCFLLFYGGSPAVTIGRMRDNLDLAGWDGCWPDWVATAPAGAHLTKAGAQLWLRHLFALEPTHGAPAGYVLAPLEPTADMVNAPDTIIQAYGARLIYQRMLAARPLLDSYPPRSPL